MNLDGLSQNQTIAASQDLLGQLKPSCRLTAASLAAAGSLTVDNPTGFAIGNYAVLGNFGDPLSEIVRLHTVTAPTATVVTLNANDVYQHPANTPLTVIDWNQVEFSHAATVDGSKSTLATVNLQADRTQTTYTTTTTTGYFFFRFVNSAASTFSDYATAITSPATASDSNVGAVMLEGCSLTGVDPFTKYTKEDQLILDFNEGQRMVSKGRDWVFELSEDQAIPLVQGENDYDLSSITPILKYPLNYQGFISVKVGNRPLTYLDPEDMDAVYQWSISDELSVACNPGDNSVTLVNSSSFPDQGTVDIGENIGVSYSANDKTTGILSGIPTTGDGSIGFAAPIGRSVFFGFPQSWPVSYTVYNGVLRLNCPANLQSAGIDFKFRFIRRLPTITSFQDTTLIPFFEDLSYFVASKIERRKRNYADADGFLKQFEDRLTMNYSIYKMPQEQNYYRYEIMSNSTRYDNWFGGGGWGQC